MYDIAAVVLLPYVQNIYHNFVDGEGQGELSYFEVCYNSCIFQLHFEKKMEWNYTSSMCYIGFSGSNVQIAVFFAGFEGSVFTLLSNLKTF